MILEAFHLPENKKKTKHYIEDLKNRKHEYSKSGIQKNIFAFECFPFYTSGSLQFSLSYCFLVFKLEGSGNLQ